MTGFRGEKPSSDDEHSTSLQDIDANYNNMQKERGIHNVDMK